MSRNRNPPLAQKLLQRVNRQERLFQLLSSFIMSNLQSAFNAVVVLGATASGKTAIAVHLANLFRGEIISADSRQVYKGLDIGTGKDLSEYGNTPYHLIDIVSLPDEYNVFRFKRDFAAALKDVLARGHLPILAGGTGLYIESAVRDYCFSEVPKNPALRDELITLDTAALLERLSTAKAALGEKVHPDDTTERLRIIRAIEIAEGTLERAKNSSDETMSLKGLFKPLVIGVRYPRSELKIRIEKRLDARLSSGLIEEVERVHKEGITWERLERLGLEYRHSARYLQGATTFADYRQALLADIGRFAKRQETWFRRMERRGIKIIWIDRGDKNECARRLINAGLVQKQ